MKLLEKLKAGADAYEEENNFTCDVCGREVFLNERICAPCLCTLPFQTTVCPFCGRRVREEGVCLECKAKPLGVRKARSVFSHDGDAARLVIRFKRGEKYLCRTLGDLLLPLVEKEFPDADAVVFVPMTKKAERKRGFNQSRLLAERVAREGRELLDVVSKNKESSSQKALTRREREENLVGCFHVFDRKAVRGRHILIVDDILTTGATVSELAGALRRAGAAEVDAVTVTSAENKHPFGLPPEEKS